MLLKDSAMERANFYLKEWRGVRCLFKSLLLADLLGSQHLLKILQTLQTFKNSEKVVKVDVSKNVCYRQRQFFTEIKEGNKVCCVNILRFC